MPGAGLAFAGAADAGMAGGGFVQAALRRGELAGLPEPEELFQAGEEARQGGHDQGVDGVRNPGAVLLPCLRIAAQAGEMIA